MSELENKVTNEEVKQEENAPAEVVKEEVKSEEVTGEAKGEEPAKDEPKTEPKKETTKKATGKKDTKKKETPKKTDKAKTESKKEEVKPDLPPIQYKSYASSSKNVAIHSLMLQVKNGKLNLNHPVQRRANQWGDSSGKKEKFLNSLICGIISPEIIVCEMNGEKFVVDGKQRLSTLFEYIVKKDNPKLKVFNRSFDELDEQTKDQLTGSNINVVTYANITDDSEIHDLFSRYNNGVSLSNSQKSRAYCSIAMLGKIKSILEKPFFTEKANITKGQELKDEDTIVLVQSAILCSGFDFKSFNGKEVDRFLQLTPEKEIMQTLEEVANKVDILDSILENQKYKNLKKIHLPMIISTAEDSEAFKDKLLNFLNEYDNESNAAIQEYRSHCQGSTSQKENVLGRLRLWKS